MSCSGLPKLHVMQQIAKHSQFVYALDVTVVNTPCESLFVLCGQGHAHKLLC